MAGLPVIGALQKYKIHNKRKITKDVLYQWNFKKSTSRNVKQVFLRKRFSKSEKETISTFINPVKASVDQVQLKWCGQMYFERANPLLHMHSSPFSDSCKHLVFDVSFNFLQDTKVFLDTYPSLAAPYSKCFEHICAAVAPAFEELVCLSDVSV